MHVPNSKTALTHVTISISGISYGYFFLVICLVFIGECTALVGDIADHLGCFINLKDEVTAIAFVALSVPGNTVGLEFSQNFSVLCSVGISTTSWHLLLWEPSSILLAWS